MAKKKMGRNHTATAPHHKLSSHAANVGGGMGHSSHQSGNKECGLPAQMFGSEETYPDGGHDHHLGCNAEDEE